MDRREVSREELFAMVWERPTEAIARDLGVSGVALGKLCVRMQVPKPPRGYWARVEAGRTPRRPALRAFQEEIERRRQATVRAQTAEMLTKLQQQFYDAALSDLSTRGIDVTSAKTRGGRVPDLSPDLAAQILLLIQNRAHDWVQKGVVPTRWVHSVEQSAANLIGRILPLARSQVLVFESDRKKGRFSESEPVVMVRLTPALQERIAALVRIIREQKLQHVVMPLIAADFAWSARHLYEPHVRMFLDTTLCVSATEIWVESLRRRWREEDPPERFSTARKTLRTFMPIDYMPPVRVARLPPLVSRAATHPYRDRLQVLIEAERIHQMLTRAAYDMERTVPDDKLALAERIWFGEERPFSSARQAWKRLEDELERWETQLEAERSALALSILGIEVGDIVTTGNDDRLLRISVTRATLYAGDDGVTFVVDGIRFRKDGSLGKIRETFSLRFEGDKKSASK
jgi:hypothetical protein